MTYRKHIILLVAASAAACTDVRLYKGLNPPYQANKLTLSGTICTDDPRQRNFPVKVLFIIDTSSAVMAEQNDNHGWRGKAVNDVISLWSKSPNYHFGVISYGARPRNFIESGFTKDSSLLSAAAASVQGSGGVGAPSGCIGGRCRDLEGAMGLASSIITGDILAGDPGEIARTTYVMVLFAGGPPVPAISRCGCRDRESEAYAEVNGEPVEMWAGCLWQECDGCKVTCPDNATCEFNVCYPSCTPGCGNNEYCDSDYICKEMDNDFSGRPTVEPISSMPAWVPDTFTQSVPPANPVYPLPASASSCALSCVYEGGQGNTESCEEKTLVNLVRDLKSFATANGAAQLQLHATYLPDQVERDASDPFAPPCGAEADQARTVRLLNEMAFAGNGDFQLFGEASAISFGDLDLHTTADPLIFKELVVSNLNVLAEAGELRVDTDGDGLTDVKEESLGTCSSDEDTDGDGLGDAIEVKLALDPLAANDPVECIDLDYEAVFGQDPCAQSPLEKSWRIYKDRDGNSDRDGDKLNPCEERLLGLQDSLFDSDGDGLPDRVEFICGTNYLARDQLDDMDMDGIVNRDEVRGHTDARSNDAQYQLDLAYRYEEVDEGVKEIRSVTQPSTLYGITIKNVSANSANGLGWLKFTPGSEGQPPTLAWRDPEDMGPGGDFGPPVDISRPNQDGYRVESCLRDDAGGCTPESQERFITVMVEGEGNYFAEEGVDTIVISSAQRNCIRFRVRNITLMETGVDRFLGTPGNNTIDIYFAEAPKKAKTGYGIFRVRSIQLNYRLGPPEERTPRGAEMTIADDDFTVFE